jgi:hypothetical protein
MVDVSLVPFVPAYQHDFGGGDALIGGGPTALKKARLDSVGEFAFLRQPSRT